VETGPSPAQPLPQPATLDASELAVRLGHAKILVDLGEVDEAEARVCELLDARPEDLDVLSLYAKILHVRGKLTQALSCWAQIHMRSPHNENALAYLGALLSFARDPERGAGDFVALGQLRLQPKPRAQIELEEAFLLFLQRRPAEARAACDAIAARSAGRDPEQHKLAVLAKAWIAEMSGELGIARETLEELGRVRGLETDTDRVLALVRVYERIGGEDELLAAAHICRFLERTFEKISVLARLASIYERLGQHDQAAAYASRHLAHFRRRMHVPSMAEVLATAARRYLPLSALGRVRTCDPAPPGHPTPREDALCLALHGADDAARAGFAAGGQSLDDKYLGDLAQRGGDEEVAARFRLRAHRADPGDLAVLGLLLDAVATCEEVAVFFRDREAAERARWTLESALRGSPLRADLWRRLSTVLLLLGRAEEGARLFTRATTLDEAARRDREPVGRALAAAVYQFVGKTKGLVHQVWAGRRPAEPGRGGHLGADDILGNLTPEMIRAVRNTFLSVREYARSKFPHICRDVMDWSYTYKVTKEDEPSGGLSAGLPSGLAFLSAILQRPLRQDFASTGLLVADAHDVLVVRRVGDAPQKVKAAYHRNLRMLLLPSENREDLARNEHVPPEICAELVRYVENFDQAVTLAFGEGIWTA
jgi:tetratricopeptide (TPR) repeat protein